MAILEKDPTRTHFDCGSCGASLPIADGFSYDPNSAGCLDPETQEGSAWVCNPCADEATAADADYRADLRQLEALGRLDDNGELIVRP